MIYWYLNTVLLFGFLFYKALRDQFFKIAPWCTAWKFICTYLPLDPLTVMTFWLLFDLRYEIYHIKQISLTKLEKLSNISGSFWFWLLFSRIDLPRNFSNYSLFGNITDQKFLDFNCSLRNGKKKQRHVCLYQSFVN